MSMVRRLVLFATLALFLAVPAAWAQVSVTGASYDGETNTLTITFDGTVYTSSQYVTPALLAVDDDNGGRKDDMQLVSGQVTNVSATGTNIDLYLIYGGVLANREYEVDLEHNVETRDVWGNNIAQTVSIETALDTENLSLIVEDGAFIGTDDVPVGAATVEMSYVAMPEEDVVTLDSAKYNAFTNVLRLVFSDVVQFDQIPEDISEDNPENPAWPGPGNGLLNGLPDEDLNLNGVLDMEQNVTLGNLTFADTIGGTAGLVSSLDLTKKDSTVLELELSRSERANFEALDVDGQILLSFPEFSFVDQNYNSVAPSSGIVVEYTSDSDPAVADSATYSMGENELVVYWSQPMNANISEVTLVPKFYFSRVHGGSVDSTYQMTSARKTISGDQLGVIMSFNNNEQDNRGIEDLVDQAASGDSFVLYIEPGASMTDAGNLSIEGEDVPVRIIPEDTRNFAPQFAGNPTYDAATGVFTAMYDTRIQDDYFTFIDPTDGSEDTTLQIRYMDIERFHFVSGTDTVTLRFEDRSYYTRIDRISGNSGIQFTALDEERLGIGQLADKDNIKIVVDPYAVRQFKTYNGNRAVTASLDYVADTNVPLVAVLWYNSNDGSLVVGTNVMISESNIDLTKLTSFAGVSSLEYDSTFVVDEKQIGYYLKPSVVSVLNALSYEEQASVVASWEAGFITNNDGVETPAETDVVGGTQFTTAIDEVTLTLGFGKTFMITSYEAFPTEPREVRASLQRVSDHGLWFVENEEFSDGSVTPADLDRAVKFFEDSTEYDPTMGAHDVLLNAFAGTTDSELLSATPTFLFVDVWDEWDLGRNDSEDGLWYPGYVESDEDIIYLDSDPADYTSYPSDDSTGNGLRGLSNLYSRYVVDKQDAFEQSWIRMGLAFMGEFLVGSRNPDSTGFVQPHFYSDKVLSTDGIPGDNSLVFVGSVLKSRTEWEHLYLFFMYVYEKYGEQEIIQAIASSRRIGVEGFQTVLDARWAAGDYDDTPWLKQNFDDLYLDFATANLLDMSLGEDVDHGLYEFANIDINHGNSNPGPAWKWAPSLPPPYQPAGVNYGFSYFTSAYVPTGGLTLPLLSPPGEVMTLSVTNPDLDKRFRKVNLNVELVKFGQLSDFTIQDTEFDDNGQALLPMDDGEDWVFGPQDSSWATFHNFILIATNSGSFLADHVTGEDVTTEFYVSQNSVYGHKVDLFLVASEPIYNFDGATFPVISAYRDSSGTMGSEVALTLSTEEDYLLSESVGDALQYIAHVWMSEEGTFYWVADGFVANGDRINTGDPSVMSVSSLKPGESNLISLGDAGSLLASGAAVDEVRPLNMILNHTSSMLKGNVVASQYLRPLGVTLQMVVDEKKLNDPATLTLKFDVDEARGEPVGIFFEHEGSWKYVGGNVDWEAGTVSTQIGQLGNYQVMAGALGEIPSELALPQSFSLKQNYPNPFNPTTTIEMVLPRAGDVQLVIYDVLGREVVKLVDGPMRFGSHRVVWNGRSASGQALASGVYFVQMQANSFRDVKKMVLVK